MDTKFEDSGSNRRSEICDGKFMGEKKKTNIGNNKNEDADRFLHNTKKSMFVPNFKIRDAVVA